MKLYHYILIIGGLLLTLNVIYPPMIYENRMINHSHYIARHFFMTTIVTEPARKNDASYTNLTGRDSFEFTVQLNVSRLATQEFLIIGIMCIALGFTIPKDEAPPPTT